MCDKQISVKHTSMGALSDMKKYVLVCIFLRNVAFSAYYKMCVPESRFLYSPIPDSPATDTDT